MTSDLAWTIFGCTVLALAAIEVARACRAARRRDTIRPEDFGA